MKLLLSGNEAIARGAYEAGVKVAAAYPGTPSTEILENIIDYPDIYAEWAPNEKVALEVGIGASIAGERTIVVMKHVGVNVAADPLFTLSYTGVRGGVVIITADDPAMHSSQNEQDNRNYAKFAKVPMLEPSDSQEAKDFVLKAFEISETFDTPVFIRTTTRVSHSKSLVELSEPAKRNPKDTLERDPQKYVMLPNHARARHPLVEKRLDKLQAFSDAFEENRIELNDLNIGIIADSVAYQYAKEAFPEYSFLKISMVHPLPLKKIREFADQVKKLYVFEELDPFIEEQVKALGISVTGKDVFPICGEFDPSTAIEGISGLKISIPNKPLIDVLPPRPPNMCPGCPHRGLFYTLKQLKVFVTGDIGCYTLAALPPLQIIDSCICMGASIGNAHGIDKALGDKIQGKVVAVIGDSTFMHSGITGLLDIVYNNGNSTVIILDNRTTAMTGRQENPGTGYTLMGKPAKRLDLEALTRALGVEHVRKVDPYDLKTLKAILKDELERKAPSVIITEAPCVLHKRSYQKGAKPLTVNSDVCIGCKTCTHIGCPAISFVKTDDKKGKSVINEALCTGCDVCAQICKVKAIS
ncbi:MAG: indolepyruvate ferredoxin oxidoreductase subunit alpha [Proteobacteria bacterium]|nr:indolepyruvate ferredoxin oxidoreductase subunit alpha [Pseudomonadota bacterium]